MKQFVKVYSEDERCFESIYDIFLHILLTYWIVNGFQIKIIHWI